MTGSWNGTTYNGDATNDIATGTSAANSMFGREGDDALDGGDGDDAIDGGVGSDNLQGGAGADRLWDYSSIPPGFSGVIGHDTIRGGDGDDHINFWSPDTGDVAMGGAGHDTLEVRFNYSGLVHTHAISFVLGNAPSVIQVDGVNTVAVSQIEDMLFVANDGNDFITGADGADTIAGQGGNDAINGMGGDDWLDGGKGVQDIEGGKGTDTASFDLSDVADSLNIVSGRTISLGAWGSIRNVETLSSFATGTGDDTIKIDQAAGVSIRTNWGNDKVVLTGAGGDGVQAGDGDDFVNTGDGSDGVDPGAGADIVYLGAGDDDCDYYLTGSRLSIGADKVYGEDGNDAIYLAAGADLLDGGVGNDTLYGGREGDTALGGDGNDQIQGEGGADRLDGGEGADVIGADYDYNFSTTTVDNDRLAGGGGNDILSGGLGRDLLDGGLGDDTLQFSAVGSSGLIDFGLDEILGGDGIDILGVYGPFGTSTEAYKVGIGPDVILKIDGRAAAHAVSMERLYFTTQNAGDHVITGGELNDTIVMGSGDSYVKALGGDDSILTGGGSDTILAGAGVDAVTGQIGGADDIDLGSKNDSLLLYDYNAGADLTGGVFGAVYDGGAGTDKLELQLQQAGVTFDGQTVRYNGASICTLLNFETIKFNGSTGGATFNGSAGGDYVGLNTGDNAVNGLGGNDTITTGAGADTLNGGDGDDRITGGGGADQLTGAAGADTFVYSALSQSGGAAIDRIADFGAGDRIDLSLIDADAAIFGDQAFHLGGGGGHAGDIVVTYDAGNNRTVVNLYVNADATIDGVIWLTGDHSGLTLGDFVP
jgi:Ca2+-binding RTX toxin-like protein